MTIKLNIGVKSGKSFKKELSVDESRNLYGKKCGETLRGEFFGISGSAEFEITGASDKCGFPMRKDLPGVGKKRILLTKGVGFRGKLRKKRFGGLRLKKTVSCNTIDEKIVQLNLKCVKDKGVVEKMFAPKEERVKKEENKREVKVDEKKV